MRSRMSEGLAHIGEPLKEALERTPKPRDIEQEFIDAWNAGKVRRVSDGAKPWVGLTDAEKKLLWVDFNDWNARMLIDVVEAKLKEKNT